MGPVQSVKPLTDRKLDQLCINTMRTLSIDGVQEARSGHPGTPMALAPLVRDLPFVIEENRSIRSLPMTNDKSRITNEKCSFLNEVRGIGR